jgi:arsenate reductase (thioredoxin)
MISAMNLHDDDATGVDPKPVLKTPWILFLGRRDAERTQMAVGFARRIGGAHIVAHSAGAQPAEHVSPAVIEAMREKGIDISKQRRQELSEEIELRADIIVTLEGASAGPAQPEKQYRDWDIEDPLNKEMQIVRFIRDEIQARVRALLKEMTK